MNGKMMKEVMQTPQKRHRDPLVVDFTKLQGLGTLKSKQKFTFEPGVRERDYGFTSYFIIVLFFSGGIKSIWSVDVI